MHYIINNVIRFNSDEYTLEQIHEPHSSVILTATMSRLLYFLIRNQGVNVTRDDILSQVWEAHGLRASTNSLNKYISDLRQIFRTLEVEEDVIVTIPRVGFSISTGIMVTRDTVNEEDERESKSIVVKHNHFLGSYRFMLISFSVLFLLLWILYFVHINNSGNDDYTEKQKIYPIGMIDNCPVVALKPIAENLKSRNMEITRHILNKYGMHCEAESLYYIRFSDDVIYHNPGRVFLADCSIRNRSEGTLSSCYNYYGSDYETTD